MLTDGLASAQSLITRGGESSLIPPWAQNGFRATEPLSEYRASTRRLHVGGFVAFLIVACTLLAWVIATDGSPRIGGFPMVGFPILAFGILFWLARVSMMLPGAVTMIPTFLIWNSLGFVGTLVPLWAQNLFASAFYVFLLRQFMLGLPRDIFDAARVDGASNWDLFWRIALPLSKPALAVTFVFEVQAVWTDLMRALIYLRDSTDFTVPRGLKSLVDAFGFGGEWHWELIVTASVIATVPMIIVFFVAQRQIIHGISAGGVKG